MPNKFFSPDTSAHRQIENDETPGTECMKMIQKTHQQTKLLQNLILCQNLENNLLSNFRGQTARARSPECCKQAQNKV